MEAIGVWRIPVTIGGEVVEIWNSVNTLAQHLLTATGGCMLSKVAIRFPVYDNLDGCEE